MAQTRCFQKTGVVRMVGVVHVVHAALRQVSIEPRTTIAVVRRLIRQFGDLGALVRR